jgi:glutamyl-tRNA(Gln) amidotransferase subunit D
MHTGDKAKMFDGIEMTFSRRDIRTTGQEMHPPIEGLFIGWEYDRGLRFLSLKLRNGYNIGIAEERITSLKVIDRRNHAIGSSPPPASSRTGEHIALLSMGGTIASRVDYITGAVRPANEQNELLDEIKKIDRTSFVRTRIVSSILSEDIKVKDWTDLAKEVCRSFSDGAIGCIVTHGTDTMALTATALSFLLRDLPGPVIFVGSQRSSDRPSTDALMNLRDSLIAARSPDVGEVLVLMHGTSSDDVTHLHRGNRVKKMHTSRRDSFTSPNSHPLGLVQNDGIVWLDDPILPSKNGPTMTGGFDEKVMVIKATPQLDADLISYAAGRYHALVIEGTGLGHIRSDLVPTIRNVVDSGIPVILTSSCPHGMVNLNVYATGRMLIDAGAIPAYDMTLEAAMIKTMYIMNDMGSGDRPIDIHMFEEKFHTDISGEIRMRTDPSSFGCFKEGDRPYRAFERRSGG